MKKLINTCLLAGISLTAFGQSSGEVELDSLLRNKTSFYEVQSTVLGHYEQKIRTETDETRIGGFKKKLKHWNRKFWWNENFIDNKGKVENYNARLRMAIAKQEKAESAGNRYQVGNWTFDGPTYNVHETTMGDGMGRFDEIAFHPTNTNIIFAGSPGGGLYKTVNGGASWTNITSFLPSLGVGGIAIHPGNPNIIYVLSGDANDSKIYSTRCDGVYKTTNGGATWFRTGDFAGLTMEDDFKGHDLIMDPSDPNTLYVALSVGLWKTTNGGASWFETGTGILGSRVWDVELKPGQSSVVYIALADAFLKSTNSGATFTQTQTIVSSRISIAVTPADPDIVMLLAGRDSEGDDIFRGVFKSENSGTSFTEIYDDDEESLFNSYIDLNVTSGQVDYNNTIVIHPEDPDIVLVGGLCVWSSDDGGSSWTQETAYWAWSEFLLGDYIHPDQHHLAYNTDGKVYVANDGGVYVSDDDGYSWDYISEGLGATMFYHFQVENDEGDTWGGTQDNGILERIGTNGGYYVYYAGDGFDVMTDHPYVVADGESDDIYYTLNESIRGDNTDISIPDNLSFFGNLAMDPTDEDHIYVGYDHGLYQSTDAGEEWNLLNSGASNWCISSCPSNSNRVYYAGRCEDCSISFRRRDGASSVSILDSLIAAGYHGGKITDIEVSSTNSSVAYVSVAGFNESSKVFVTGSGGFTWSNITYNLPNVPVFCLELDPSGGIYAGTLMGVYYKASSDNYWQLFSNGLPMVAVTQMELYNFLGGQPNNIMISTYGRGIWKSSVFQTFCPTTLTLSGSVEGLYYKDANTTINSTQVIEGNLENNIKYNSGFSHALLPGFWAKTGSKFTTFLEGCGEEIEVE